MRFFTVEVLRSAGLREVALCPLPADARAVSAGPVAEPERAVGAAAMDIAVSASDSEFGCASTLGGETRAGAASWLSSPEEEDPPLSLWVMR